MFLVHIGLAVVVTLENKAARPVSYYVKAKTGRGASFASSTMPYTGLIILIFLVWHIINFKFGPHYEITHDAIVMRDLYRLLLEYFSNPVHVFSYVFAMIALGIHLSHGFWSAFQSLGFNHPKYNCTLKCAAKVFAVAMALGYSALPIFCYFKGGN